MNSGGGPAWPRIRSYREFRQAVRGRTARELRPLYDRRYYETHVGNEELGRVYAESAGLEPTEYTRRPLDLARIRRGDEVLDVGCGRGELVLQAAQRGASAVGVDFSDDAISIATRTRERVDDDIRDRTAFVCGNAEQLPFSDSSFDTVFLLDVVEHLAPAEIRRVLAEVRRVIRPSGVLIVHTTPNRWSRTFGHHAKSLAAIATRRARPIHPIVAQFDYLERAAAYDAQTVFLHINEQSVLSLKVALLRSGFRSRVWLDETGDRWRGKGGARATFASLAYRVLGLKLVFGWSIFAVARPR